MSYRTSFVLLFFAAALFSSGCVRIATAPLRAERREKAEAAIDRLAQLPPETIAAGLTRRMTDALALTPSQQLQVEAINLKYARQLHDLATGPESVRQKARAMRTQRNAKTAEFKAILSSDQFSRFEAMKDELREAAEQAR